MFRGLEKNMSDNLKWQQYYATSLLSKIKNPLASLPDKFKLRDILTLNSEKDLKQDDLVERFLIVIQVEDEYENQQEALFSHSYNWRGTDREEIRRKLAMGSEDEFTDDKELKKPSLQSRIKNGKNLQICFMNETASDDESQCSDTESTQDRIDEIERNSKDIKRYENDLNPKTFLERQAKLKEEARVALSQAKNMARMQMELDKQNRTKSPITEIVRDSFTKVGFPFPESKRRMSRQILTDMNVAQLQVIMNDFHTHIEKLNEVLVHLLLQRDDLHMEQDSMLVDIEDLTKHLGAKVQTATEKTDGKVNNKTSKVKTLSAKIVKLKDSTKK